MSDPIVIRVEDRNGLLLQPLRFHDISVVTGYNENEMVPEFKLPIRKLGVYTFRLNKDPWTVKVWVVRK